MVKSIFKKIREYLNKHRSFRSICIVIQQTPEHALHWYMLIVIGVVITVTNVCIAWFIFSGISSVLYSPTEQSQSTTINREELTEVLQVYQTRNAEFEQLKRITPEIIDPGR